MKILILLAKWRDADDIEKTARGEIPRVEYLELVRRLGAHIVSFADVAESAHPFVRFALRRGPRWGLAALAFTRRRAYDQFYVTGEDIGIPFATMMRFVRDLGRITVVVHMAGAPRVRRRLSALGHAIWRNVIVVGTRQRDIVTAEIRYPAYKVHFFELMAPDTRFFRSANGAEAGTCVFSCGREGRDYQLLQQAAATMPFQFRVIASGWAAHTGFEPAGGIVPAPNITVQSNVSHAELRSAYENARFVVMPIARVDYAAGVTAICEAMAMGKAIIATDSPGIQDYVRHGISGLIVPVGNVAELRRAITELWNDPARCARMGARNRAWIETSINVDRYVARVAGLFGIDPTA